MSHIFTRSVTFFRNVSRFFKKCVTFLRNLSHFLRNVWHFQEIRHRFLHAFQACFEQHILRILGQPGASTSARIEFVVPFLGPPLNFKGALVGARNCRSSFLEGQKPSLETSVWKSFSRMRFAFDLLVKRTSVADHSSVILHTFKRFGAQCDDTFSFRF